MRLATERTETENLFAILANESPVGICIIQDEKFCYTNPTFQHNTGYREDELLGRDSLELIVPEDRETARENAIKILKGESTLPHQSRVMRKDGSTHWIVESFASIQYRGRRAILGNYIEITEHKQTEEALQAEKNKLQSLIDTLEDHITIRDRDYNLIYMAEHAKKLWGDRTGEKCYRVLEGQDKVCDRCPVEKAFRDGKSHTSERKTVTPSGEVLRWETRANPIRDAEGRIIACLEIARNITEFKQVQRTLQAEKDKLQSLIDAIDYTITIQDTKYNVIYQNAPSRIASGGNQLGEKCYRAYEGNEKVCDGCPVKKAFEDGKTHTTERKTEILGKVALWENTAIPIRDAEGKIVSCLELARDITERKQAEEALQMEKNKLQSIIDGMTDALTIQDRDYKIVFQNEHSRKTTGGDRTGEKCYQVYEGRESICEDCPVEQAFKDGKSHTMEKRVATPSGEVSFWENTANPIRDASGKIVSCVEIGRNITERKEQEQALADELTRRRLLVDQSVDGIVVIDENDKVYEANQRFAQMLGYTPEEVRELHTWDWEKNIPREQIHELGRKADEKGFLLETTHTRKDGSVIDVDISINASMFGGQKLIFCVCRDVTERKKAQQALADELTQRRLLIDKSLDGIVVLDEDAKVVEANQRFVDMLGYTLEEIRKLHTWDWDKTFPPEKLLEMGRNVDEKGLHLETQHTRKDGSVIDVDISISGIMYGRRKLIFCIQRDITERNRAEEALKNSEERYRELADSIAEVFFAMDENLRYTYWNKASEILTGVRAEDALGKSLLEVFPDTPGTRGAEKVYRSVLKTQKSQTFMNDFDIDDKHYIFEIGAYPSRGGISVFARDITKRKQAEEALRASEEKYRLLSDYASDIIWTTDMNLKYTYASPSVEKLLGYTPEEFTAFTVDKILTPPSLELAVQVFQEELAAEQLEQKDPKRTRTVELELVRKDGSTIQVEIKMTFLRDEVGHPTGILGIARDITERKLQNERLTMTNRLASIGELAAGAAHEINNPLTSVIGYSQLLMEKNLPDYVRRDLTFIQSEAQRAINVTDNLLTFSRKHVPIKKLNQINNIIEDVLKFRAYSHKVNSIEVERHLAPALPEILVDYFQIQQVFLNIVINAEYFMTEANKRGTLIISTKKQNGTVSISFADDGSGIPPENLSRIFNPFFTTKDTGKGTGLGLSICHGIVTKHDGQIYAESQPGKGATIFVELPINGSNYIESI